MAISLCQSSTVIFVLDIITIEKEVSQILSSLPLGQMLEATGTQHEGLHESVVNRYMKDFIQMMYCAVTEDYFTEYQVDYFNKLSLVSET